MSSPLAFDFVMPVEVHFGRGGRHRLGEMLRHRGARTALLVTDPGLAGSGVVADVRHALEAADIGVSLFTDVEANPRIEQVDAGAEQARRAGAGVVVGVGGGSSMDVAKGVAVLLTNPGPISAYDGGAAVPAPGVPWAAVPTTAGTGSEVTPFANFSDKRRGYKFSVAHRHFYASVAVVDPEATVGMPPAVTAMTGMDALAHAVESYVARTSHPASEALALRAIQLIGGELERAHDNGDDLDAREAVLLGSLLAGMAFVSTRLGVLHALAMPLGGVTDLPHGMILAALFAHGVRLNQPSRPGRFADLATALGRPGGDSADAVDALRERLGLPAVLHSPALDGAAIEGIVDAAMRSVNVRSNPAEMTREALASILGRAAINGGN